MKKYFNLFILSFLILGLFVSCKKTEEVTPDGQLVTLCQLKANPAKYKGTYVRLDNVQFATGDVGKAFGGSYTGVNLTNPNGTGLRTLQDCIGNTITVATDAMSAFVGGIVPSGSGTFRGVISIFSNNVPQISITKASDFANMTAPPCTIVPTTCPPIPCDPNAQLKTIAEVRALFTSGTFTITDNIKLRGTVTSDRTNGNVTGRNVYIEDATAGILVRFDVNHTLNLNDQIDICLKGLTLSQFNRLLQLNAATTNVGALTPNATPITPTDITIAQLLSGSFESRLIRIQNVQFTTGGIYSGADVISNGTANATVFTQTTANFASAILPTGCLNVVGNASIFSTGASVAPTDYQIILRNTTDVTTATGCSGGGGAATLETIANVRALTAGAISSNIKIRGVVISDWVGNNITGSAVNKQNFVIQDASAGIVIRLSAASTAAIFPYLMGETVEINLQGKTLGLTNGLLQISGVLQSDITDLGVVDPMPAVQIITITDLNGASPNQYESELVQINGVTFGTGTYAGNQNFTVGALTGQCRTNNSATSPATFSTNVLPTGAVNIRGIAGVFTTTRQIQPRNASDLP